MLSASVEMVLLLDFAVESVQIGKVLLVATRDALLVDACIVRVQLFGSCCQLEVVGFLCVHRCGHFVEETLVANVEISSRVRDKSLLLVIAVVFALFTRIQFLLPQVAIIVLSSQVLTPFAIVDCLRELLLSVVDRADVLTCDCDHVGAAVDSVSHFGSTPSPASRFILANVLDERRTGRVEVEGLGSAQGRLLWSHLESLPLHVDCRGVVHRCALL